MTQQQTPQQNLVRRILRERDASAYIGLPPTTLGRLRTRGDGPPYIQLGPKAIGYDLVDLDAWIASRRRTSTSAPLAEQSA